MSLINDLIQNFVAQQNLIDVIINGDFPDQDEIDELNSRIEELEQSGSGGSGSVENAVVFDKVEELIPNEDKFKTVLKNVSGSGQIEFIEKPSEEQHKIFHVFDETGAEIISDNRIFNEFLSETDSTTLSHIVEVNQDGVFHNEDFINYIVSNIESEEEKQLMRENLQLQNQIKQFTTEYTGSDGVVAVLGKLEVEDRLQSIRDDVDQLNEQVSKKIVNNYFIEKENNKDNLYIFVDSLQSDYVLRVSINYETEQMNTVVENIYVGDTLNPIISDKFSFEWAEQNLISGCLDNSDYPDALISIPDIEERRVPYEVIQRIKTLENQVLAVGNDVVKSARIYEYYPNDGDALVIEFNKFPENRIMYLTVDYRLNDVDKQCYAQFVFGRNETEKFLAIDASTIISADFAHSLEDPNVIDKEHFLVKLNDFGSNFELVNIDIITNRAIYSIYNEYLVQSNEITLLKNRVKALEQA